MILIKRIPNKIEIKNFIVNFSYKTIKGYYREQQRQIYDTDINKAQIDFLLWVNNQRTMTNVKILAIEETDNTKTINA